MVYSAQIVHSLRDLDYEKPLRDIAQDIAYGMDWLKTSWSILAQRARSSKHEQHDKRYLQEPMLPNANLPTANLHTANSPVGNLQQASAGTFDIAQASQETDIGETNTGQPDNAQRTTLSTSSRVSCACLGIVALWGVWSFLPGRDVLISDALAEIDVADASALAVVNSAAVVNAAHDADAAEAKTAAASGLAANSASASNVSVQGAAASNNTLAQNDAVRRQPAIALAAITPVRFVAPQTDANSSEFSAPNVPQLKLLAPLISLPTPTPTLTPTPRPVPTATPRPLDPGRLWSAFVPRPAAEIDHFWIARPFPASVRNQLASPSYQFGSTANDRYRAHHGIDISNPLGSPVLAGVVGEVIHAGLDDPALIGPYNNFYGNVVVIRLDRRLPVAGGELDVFALYGHLSAVNVTAGQHVEPGDVVGAVGMTGIAIGPHLHVEVRLGANTYEHSVNPYLWLQPLNNTGAVAVRLLTADGRTWPGGRVSIVRFGANGSAAWARHVETYRDVENLGPDPHWGENGAMGSIPPGRYVVVAAVNGERLRTEVEVYPGQTSFVELRTQR